jgi:hypothetical protein
LEVSVKSSHLLQGLVKARQAVLELAAVVSVAAGACTAKLFSCGAGCASAVAADGKFKFTFKAFHGEDSSPIGFDF